MKKYEKYKDSGVEWLGEIPEHWELYKLGRTFDNVSSGSTPKTSVEAYYRNPSVNWLNTGDLLPSLMWSWRSSMRS